MFVVLLTILNWSFALLFFSSQDQASEFVPMSNWAYLNLTITDGDDLGPVFIYDTCPTSQLKPCIRPKYSATIVGDTIPSQVSAGFDVSVCSSS